MLSTQRATLFLLLTLAAFALYLFARNPLGDLALSLNVAPDAETQNAEILRESVKSGIWRLQFASLALTGLWLGTALQAWIGSKNRPSRFAGGIDWLIRTPALPLSLVAALIGMNGILDNNFTINGSRYYVLFDDAMISMRYARNWADGFGLVWNPGETVEGYSNFLWVAVMTAIHLLRLPENLTSIPVIALNWLCVIAILWLIQSILRRIGVSPLWIFLALLGFVCDIDVIFWANSGLETPLLAFLVTACAWALLSNRRTPFLIALALIPLVRSDGFILAIALGLVYLWQNRTSWQAFLLLILATLPTLMHLAFRLAYYGDLLPNTYYLKSEGIEQLGLFGLRYGFRFFITYGLLTLPMVGAMVIVPKLRPFMLVCIFHIAYFILIGGDTFYLLRFALPVLPLIMVGAVTCLAQLSMTYRDRAVRLLAISYFLIAVPLLDNLFVAPLNAAPGWTELGVLIEANTPPDTLIAISAAGAAPYFAEQQRFIDVLGKTDTHIAHTVPPYNLGVLGHNKFDFDYLYQQRHPDVLHMIATCEWATEYLTAIPQERWLDVLQNLPRDRDVHDYFQIFNVGFVSDYYANPVTVDLPGNRGCLYLRNDSRIPREWLLNSGS